MGSVKFTKYDRNRWRKQYPRFRVLPSEGFRSNSAFVLEATKVTFEDVDTLTVMLDEDYTTAPTITVSPFQESVDGDNTVADINAWVESVTLSGVPPGGRKAIVVIRTSAKYTGDMFIQAIKVGS